MCFETFVCGRNNASTGAASELKERPSVNSGGEDASRLYF
jgi:hypothetical protein